MNCTAGVCVSAVALSVTVGFVGFVHGVLGRDHGEKMLPRIDQLLVEPGKLIPEIRRILESFQDHHVTPIFVFDGVAKVR